MACTASGLERQTRTRLASRRLSRAYKRQLFYTREGLDLIEQQGKLNFEVEAGTWESMTPRSVLSRSPQLNQVASPYKVWQTLNQRQQKSRVGFLPGCLSQILFNTYSTVNTFNRSAPRPVK